VLTKSNSFGPYKNVDVLSGRTSEIHATNKIHKFENIRLVLESSNEAI